MNLRRRIRTHTPRVHRLDGTRHWRKIVDHVVFLLMKIGVRPQAIIDAVKVSARRHRNVEPLKVPPIRIMEFSRVLTHWHTDPRFVLANGAARPLPTQGTDSFASLVDSALPGEKADDVLRVLTDNQLAMIDQNNLIYLKAREFILKDRESAQKLGYALSATEGILATLTSNLSNPDPDSHLGRVQRTVIAERFDPRHLPEFDQFSREQITQLMSRLDEWLKARESDQVCDGVALQYVGLGIFGFRAK